MFYTNVLITRLDRKVTVHQIYTELFSDEPDITVIKMSTKHPSNTNFRKVYQILV